MIVSIRCLFTNVIHTFQNLTTSKKSIALSITTLHIVFLFLITSMTLEKHTSCDKLRVIW